jgi:hypothetical protein
VAFFCQLFSGREKYSYSPQFKLWAIEIKKAIEMMACKLKI